MASAAPTRASSTPECPANAPAPRRSSPRGSSTRAPPRPTTSGPAASRRSRAVTSPLAARAGRARRLADVARIVDTGALAGAVLEARRPTTAHRRVARPPGIGPLPIAGAPRSRSRRRSMAGRSPRRGRRGTVRVALVARASRRPPRARRRLRRRPLHRLAMADASAGRGRRSGGLPGGRALRRGAERRAAAAPRASGGRRRPSCRGSSATTRASTSRSSTPCAARAGAWRARCAGRAARCVPRPERDGGREGPPRAARVWVRARRRRGREPPPRGLGPLALRVASSRGVA